MARTIFQFTLLVIFYLLQIGSAFAIPSSIAVNHSVDRIGLEDIQEVLLTEPGLTWEKIHSEWDELSQDVGNPDIDFIYTDKSVWTRFALRNEGVKPLQYILAPTKNVLDYVEIIQIADDQSIQRQVVGTAVASKGKHLENSLNAVKITLSPQSNYTFYTRIESKTLIRKGFELIRDDSFFVGVMPGLILSYTLWGMALSIACFSVAMAYAFRDSCYIYYALFATSAALGQLLISGHLLVVFPYVEGGWQQIALILKNAIPLAGTGFTLTFMGRAHLYRRTRFLLLLTSVPVILDTVFLAFGSSLYSTRFPLLQEGYWIFVLVSYLHISIVCGRHGFKPARYYTLSWVMVYFFISLFLLQRYGLVEKNLFTSSAPIVGFTLKFYFFSLGLSQRQVELNRTLVRELKKTQGGLEELVEIRSKQLQVAHQEVLEEKVKAARSNKQVALIEMAGGVAHEINNPLAILQFAHDQISTSVKEIKDERAESYIARRLEMMKKSIDRIAKIVIQLRQFTMDIHEVVKEPIQLKELVQESLGLCQERFSSANIHIATDDIPDDCIVYGEKKDLLQVLYNLMQNSFDSLKGLEREKWIHIGFQQNPENYILSITDNGSGIENENVEKIFQPFFTTKIVGSGVGLGLSVAHGIIEQHDGDLYLDNQSQNTKFNLELPIYSNQENKKSA